MVIWSILVFFSLTFLVLAIAIVAFWLVFQKAAAQRASEATGEMGEPGDSALLKNEEVSSISLWRSLLSRLDFVEIMQKQIAQADLNWSVGRITMAMLLCGAVALLVLVQPSWIPLWVATGASWLAALLPYLYVLRRRTKRFERFRENFPDAMDSMARGLRAGYPFIAALDMVAGETIPPVSTELRKTFTEATLGIPLERALANLGERVPLLEVNLFSAAIQLHARTGGRLSDVMATLSENMREQVSLRGEVRSIAAHGKLTGVILTIVPIGIAGMMAIVSPVYIGVLLAHPYGKHLIAAAVVCLVAAHFVIRKIVDIKV